MNITSSCGGLVNLYQPWRDVVWIITDGIWKYFHFIETSVNYFNSYYNHNKKITVYIFLIDLGDSLVSFFCV